MLEYRCNQYDIVSGNPSRDTQPSKYYIYKGNDDSLYYTEEKRYNSVASYDYYKNQSLYMKYPDDSRSSYRFISNNVLLSDVMNYRSSNYIKHSTSIGRGGSLMNGKTDLVKETNFFYDSINVYFVRGFNLDGLDGISLRVHGKGSFWYKDGKEGEKDFRTYLKEAELTVLDFYLDKETFANGGYLIHRLATPIYMNSKFYDRYITIEFPSLYAIGLRDENEDNDAVFVTLEDGAETVYRVNPNTTTLIDFSTIQEGNTTTKTYAPNHSGVESGLTNTSGKSITVTEMTLDAIEQASVIPNSNTDYFNVMIYEDASTGSIVYYPTYGDGENYQDLSAAVMTRIESGDIKVTANGFYDLDNNTEDINDIDLGRDELYYNSDSDMNPSKWKVYNELNVIYMYRNQYINDEVEGEEPIVGYNESFSRIVDYGVESDVSTEFWKTRYTPYIREIVGKECCKICFKYTCRLVNILRGVECIRIASLFVDPSKYIHNISNYLNINTYKIVNKIQTTKQNIIQPQETVKERYVRSYYNATNLVAKNINTGATIYTQGQMTLYLNRTNNNYLIQLFNINDDNVRVPYDLTGPYKYKLVFPLNDGSSKLSISPNYDSTKQNLGIGTLVFYISGEQAKQIMNTPSTERYFAIMTELSGSAAQETTLYEGKVDWLS